MSYCPTLVDQIREGTVAFGINHEMRDFQQNRKKNFAREILETVLGGPVLPVPTRVEGGRMGPPSATDILVLAAALRASAGLTPSTPIGVGEVTIEHGAVTVKVAAPTESADGA